MFIKHSSDRNSVAKWTDDQIFFKLNNLAHADKKRHWVRWDLSISKSNWFSRAVWSVAAKRFQWMRYAFYKVDLRKSQILLSQLQLRISSEQRSELIEVFNAAVKNFNEIAPKIQACTIEGLSLPKSGFTANQKDQMDEHQLKYEIKGQRAVIEAVKASAAYCKDISERIQNYGINDQNALIEIAKIAAANEWEISKYIKNYGIKDQNALIEIAKIAAVKNAWITSERIQNYGIKDQNGLIEIAKIAAAGGSGISKFIQNYGIKDENALIEIAKIAARKEAWSTSEHIRNYGIKDQLALIEIAKISAAFSSGGISQHILNYGITDQDALIEIGKISAAKSGLRTSEHIQSYAIKDRNALVEIAKIAAAQSGLGTSESIKNYGIKDQDALIEIAKIAAANDGEGTSRYIQRYGIEDPNALIEIAKIAAANNGEGTSRHIQRYGINDEDALIEIAKIAVEKGGRFASIGIKNYRITDQNSLCEIGKKAFYRIFETTDDGMPVYKLQKYLEAWDGNPLLKNVCDITAFLIEHTELDGENVKAQLLDLLVEDIAARYPQLEKKIASSFKNVLSYNSIKWCFAARSFLLADIPENELEVLLDSGLIEEIGSLRDPKMRFTLLKLVPQLLENSEVIADFNTKLDLLKKSVESKKYLRGIISLYYALLKAQKIDTNALDHLVTFTQKKYYYSDQSKQRKLIEFLQMMVEDSCLTSDQKTSLLGYVFPSQAGEKKQDRVKESYRQIQAAIGLAGFSKLNSFRDNPDSPTSLLEKEFKALVPFGNIPDFADRFQEEITSSRSPTAVLTYAGVLSKLPSQEKEEVLAAYGTFINWLLTGKYFDHRYDLETQAAHMKAVFEARPELFEAWKKGGEIPIGELLAENHKTKELSYSFGGYLRQKILTDRHLDEKDYPLLAEYLRSSSKKLEETDSEVEKLFIELASIEIKNETKENAEQKITAASSLIDQLLEINKSLKMSFPLQFKKDLEDMKKQSKSLLVHSSFNGFVAVDTDHPIDMLLCGTDVSGSCQRVNGNPHYNKCLIAYLIDGKNRMIAIKNKEGTIVARSILRIMLSESTQKPVLLLERVYQGGANEALEEAVIAFAKLRAQELNLPLVSKEIEGKEFFHDSVCSLGSCAPYEYVDSARGIQQNGVFAISPENLHILKD